MTDLALHPRTMPRLPFWLLWAVLALVAVVLWVEPGIAAWALLGPTVELRRTPYDVEAAAALVRDTAFPEADELVNQALLHPPSAGEVTAHFESLAERQSL